MRLSFLSKDLFNYLFVTKQENSVLQTLFILLAGSLFLFISARISIGYYPIPLNMEDLAGIFVGMAFGWRLGGLIVLFHLLEGLLGIPVFAQAHTSGSALINSPTFGFMLGAFPAAIISGCLVQQGWGRSNLQAAFAALIGMGVLYLCGLVYLYKTFPWPADFISGMYPFLFVDFLKVLFLSFAIPLIYQYKQNKHQTTTLRTI